MEWTAETVEGLAPDAASVTAARKLAHPGPWSETGRDELREATGDTKLPTLKLPDGTVLHHSRAILAWIPDRH